MVPVVKQMTPVIPFMTVNITSEAFAGNVLNHRISTSQSKRLLCALVFFQHKSYDGAGGNNLLNTDEKINYNADIVTSNALIQYYHDSLFIPTSSIYIESNNKRYYANDLPIGNKERASYIVA